MQNWDLFSNFVELVADEHIALHDDRNLLMPREQVTGALILNRKLTEDEIDDLFDKGLILPVEDELYHPAISIDFLSFLTKLKITGFTLDLQQKIADMYYPIYWALCSDIEYEISKFKEEQGREPSRFELAHLRVVNEWAVTHAIDNIEQKILRLESEGNDELKKLLNEAAKKRKELKKKANFGFEEDQIRELISEIWLHPLKYFQGREVKAFININSVELTKEENKIFWTGHFDFALCDNNGIVQLVIEYNGVGHYGRSENDRKKVEINNNAKKSLCEKSGTPLIVLNSEFAYINSRKAILKKFLSVYKDTLGVIDLKGLCGLIYEQLHNLDISTCKLYGFDYNDVLLMEHRLQIYKSQERKDMLLVLLWQILMYTRNLKILNTTLNKLNHG